jgi:hypothetical protein
MLACYSHVRMEARRIATSRHGVGAAEGATSHTQICLPWRPMGSSTRRRLLANYTRPIEKFQPNVRIVRDPPGDECLVPYHRFSAGLLVGRGFRDSNPISKRYAVKRDLPALCLRMSCQQGTLDGKSQIAIKFQVAMRLADNKVTLSSITKST